MNDSNDNGRRRFGNGLEPLPETLAAIDELEPLVDVEDLLIELVDQGRQVRSLVPDCVGLSLATLARGVTLTLVASDRDIALLDAVQYLDTGPCVEAAEEARTVAFDPEDRDSDEDAEEQWRLFAEATSAAGVRSTLTLPIIGPDASVMGSVNLYAASPAAFDGVEDELGTIFSAWAPGAVRNADLSFTTRDTARQAPGILRDAARIDAAVGVLLTILGIGEQDARSRLRDAAVRAGVEQRQIADLVLRLSTTPDASPGGD
jgi:alkylhydroperoxidase family enzyme